MDWVRDVIRDGGWLATLVVVGLTVGGVVTSYLVTRRVVLPIVYRIIKRSPFRWDDILLRKQLLHRLALLGPGIFLWIGVSLIPDLPAPAQAGLVRSATALLVAIAALILSSTLTGINEIYEQHEIARSRPIRGYIQLARILLYILASVLVISVLVNRSPWLFISGLGAMTAVILLIFRNTILSLVASVQITQNDMLRVGDWIEMPKFGADGTVTDIALNAVRIQNFDKTIVAVPTYKFLDEAFTNWRGMSESGGRRIKRPINIDVSSIRFLSQDEIHRFSSFAPLRDYMASKQQELAAWNEALMRSEKGEADLRRLTNIGTFRAYVVNYLKRRPDVHTDGMTMLVRQRPPGPVGLPIEVYVFAATTDWVEFEDVQSDIFDHLLASLSLFDLRPYQAPSGHDVRNGTYAVTAQRAS